MRHYTILLVILLLAAAQVSAQKKVTIDTGNYYNYHLQYPEAARILKGNRLTTDWLREEDATPIIPSEMDKAGYTGYAQQLYQVTNSQMMVLTAYSTKPEFGFIYIGGRSSVPEKAHRTMDYWRADQEYDYEQYYYKPGAQNTSTKVKRLPPYIFILHEDCYWFQHSNVAADNAKLVTRKDAVNILRQDIRAFLARVPRF